MCYSIYHILSKLQCGNDYIAYIVLYATIILYYIYNIGSHDTGLHSFNKIHNPVS